MTSSCSLYLAPSTLAGAGLGIFTGKELHRGDSLGRALGGGMIDDAGDVCLPILDMEWHNAAPEGNNALEFPNPFRDYVWNGRALGMDREGGEFEDISAFWPGLDAAINSFSPLVNLERALPEYDPDLQGEMHRSRHPAVGSFTPYVGGSHTYVLHFVPVGGELFKDYGDSWFLDRNMTTFPVISDIPKAERLLEHFAWHVPTSLQPDMHHLVMELRQIWGNASRVLQAIPDAWSDLETIVFSKYHSKTATIPEGLRQWYQPNATRSLEWLEEHGTCLDTIRTGPSTIVGAGRGAFATRSFAAAGEIVTTSPLIHVTDRSILDLHEIGPDPKDPRKYIRLKKIGTQLAINYCFSHPETPLALCPYGKGVNSINHASSTSSSSEEKKPNLRLEWPTSPILNHNATYLTQPIDQWSSSSLKPRLAIHYVATRPIAEGDELLLDYGPEWEAAWERHVETWQQSELTQPLVPHGRDYVSAESWNRQHQSKDILWTVEEQEAQKQQEPQNSGDPSPPPPPQQQQERGVLLVPPPPFLELRCHADLISHPRTKYRRLQWDGDWTKGGNNPEYGRPCRVVRRRKRNIMSSSSSSNDTVTATSASVTMTPKESSSSSSYYYSYDVMIQTGADWQTWETDEVRRANVPRRLLKWFDQPHTTDLHLFLAFRHYLGLPEELVSQEWRVNNSSNSKNNMAAAAAQSTTTTTDSSDNLHYVTSMNLHEPVLPPGHDEEEESEIVDDKACPASNDVKSSNEEGEHEQVQQDMTCKRGAQTTTEDSTGDDQGLSQPHSILPCNLYLAPSSIQGAGLGIFAGKKYQKGDPVGSGDVVIPVRDMTPDEDDEMSQDPFEDYVWDPEHLGVAHEGEGVWLFWPGINAAVNCYPALINLELSVPLHDNAGVHRYRHPGAGAFSPYHKGTSKATRYIPAGGELFKEYGPEWFLSRDGFEGVPVAPDFDDARVLLEHFFQLLKGSEPVSTKSRLQLELYDMMKSLGQDVWQSRVFNALPDTLDSAIDLVENLDGDFGRLHQPNRTRDISWLDTNGRCLDHIVPKQSTLEGAGRGAFAKRFLPRGTILTGSPLIHVRRHALVKAPSSNATTVVNEDREINGHPDLLLNYCLGDPASSLLLCPYTNGVNYINHNRSLANVRVQWAAHGTMSQDNTKFDIPPFLFGFSKKPSLALDYIVTRDIGPDEEIFLDYGEDYETAWNRHVTEWKPEPQWESYLLAKDFNQHVALLLDKGGFLRTANEQKTDPYPENVILHCHSTLQRFGMQKLLKRGINIQDSSHMKGVFPWYDDQDDEDGERQGVENGIPCQIMDRKPISSDHRHAGFVYDIRMNAPTMERTGVPREALRFFDRVRSTDIYLQSSFRHAIGLPKEMIPSAWKDLTV